MRLPRVRVTVFRLLLVVAVCAIVTHIVTEGLNRPALERTERCLAIADNHTRLSRDYRMNSRGQAGMLRIAAWHDHMRQVFEDAATQSGGAVPISQPFPPNGWQNPRRKICHDGDVTVDIPGTALYLLSDR
jgi:hypothetical protein